MPRKQNTYKTLIVAKQRELTSGAVIGALREGTRLSMTLADFVAGVHATPEIRAAVGDVTLGDIFESLTLSGATARRAKVARRKPAPKRRATKKAKAKKPSKAPRKKSAKRGRADAQTVAKRLAAIVAVLEKNGDWMKTGDIHAEVTKRRGLFGGVGPNLISQYLGKLVAEKPARAKKKGERSLSVYRAKTSSPKKAEKKKAKAKKKKTRKGAAPKAKISKKVTRRAAKPKRRIETKSAEAKPEGG